MTYDVSQEALASYRRDGFVVLKQVLSPTEITLLRRAVDAQVRGEGNASGAYDFEDIARQVWRGQETIEVSASRFNMGRFRTLIDADPEARPLLDHLPSDARQGRFLYEAAGWRRFEEIREVAFNSALPEAAAALLDSAYVNFWEDTTFVKTPGASQRTAFHQDYTYFQIAGRKCCIAWIALDATTPQNGALEYVRGSHLWNEQFAPNLLIAQTVIPESAAKRLPDIEGNRDEYDIVQVCVEPGDVIMHDVYTVHGAGGNTTTDKPRRGISFRYCGDDVRYTDKPGAIPQPLLAARLSEGELLRDSPDYPLVWPRV